MDVRLLRAGFAKLMTGFVLVTFLLFFPAGSLTWWQGWLFLAVLFVPMLIMGVLMLFKAPDLLRKRLKTEEDDPEQRRVVALSALMFVLVFVAAGVSHRLGWPELPKSASIAAAVAFLFGYALYGEVMRENAYLSRTVQVQVGQRVIDTGLYGVVRHPMYAATLLMFLAIPAILGSPLSCLIMLTYPFLIARRIICEERVLTAGLEGYGDYCRRVRWRLVPHLW